MKIAERMKGLWIYLGPDEFKTVADYWAVKIYRDRPYPQRDATLGYLYEDGSVLFLETRTTTNQRLVDISIEGEIPDGWIVVEDRMAA